VEDIVREPVELIDHDLDEVAGGSGVIAIGELNVGIGLLNLLNGSVANVANTSIGMGVNNPTRLPE
jgi:hypothetical protein